MLRFCCFVFCRIWAAFWWIFYIFLGKDVHMNTYYLAHKAKGKTRYDVEKLCRMCLNDRGVVLYDFPFGTAKFCNILVHVISNWCQTTCMTGMCLIHAICVFPSKEAEFIWTEKEGTGNKSQYQWCIVCFCHLLRVVIFHIVDCAALFLFILTILFALLTMWAAIVSGSTSASRLVEIFFAGLIESIFCC